MLKIPLTQGRVAIVGPRDYAFLNQWRWSYHNGYAVRTDCVNGKTILMHRVILERMGHKNFARSDHINRNRLDNRRCNLRPATSSQSQCNRSKQNNNTSGYTGVSWYQGKWYAQIMVNRKHIHLKCCDDSKEAARVYNKAALKYHGKFASLNEV